MRSLLGAAVFVLATAPASVHAQLGIGSTQVQGRCAVTGSGEDTFRDVGLTATTGSCTYVSGAGSRSVGTASADFDPLSATVAGVARVPYSPTGTREARLYLSATAYAVMEVRQEDVPPVSEPQLPLVIELAGGGRSGPGLSGYDASVSAQGSGIDILVGASSDPASDSALPNRRSLSFPVGRPVTVEVSASCDAFAAQYVVILEDECGAFADPVFSFDQQAFDAAMGSQTFPLADYYSLQFSPNVPDLVPGADSDQDGVSDAIDNCSDLPNSIPAGLDRQLDADADFIGNACDCDFDNDGTCSIADFNLFLPDFVSGTDRGVGTDMDGDGVVGIQDFNRFLPGFQSARPGPSALREPCGAVLCGPALACCDAAAGTCVAPGAPCVP
jgi:hypothetical protein